MKVRQKLSKTSFKGIKVVYTYILNKKIRTLVDPKEKIIIGLASDSLYHYMSDEKKNLESTQLPSPTIWQIFPQFLKSYIYIYPDIFKIISTLAENFF